MGNTWGNNGNRDRLYFLGSKITADGDCSHEIKRHLLPGKKVMTNLDSILKSRDYFAYKVLYSQSYGFSSSHVWLWELDHKEGWVPKNWCSLTVVLEKIPESPLVYKIKPGNPKEINPKYSLKELMLKLKFQYCGHLMQRADLLEKTLILGKIEGRRRRGQQRMRCWMASPTQWTWVWANPGRWRRMGKPSMLQSMVLQIDMTGWLNNNNSILLHGINTMQYKP